MARQVAQPIIVVKIGSSVIVTRRGTLDERLLGSFAAQVKRLRRRGYGVIMVVSGAVACGRRPGAELARSAARRARSPSVLNKQVLAGIGQPILISKIRRIFKSHGLTILQMLLSKEAMKHGEVGMHVKVTIRHALEHGYVPVVNENDIVHLYGFQGNDYLAGEIAEIVSASKLILLTNVDCLYMTYSARGARNPVREVRKVTHAIREAANRAASPNGIGGMHSKVEVAARLQKHGIPTVIANGATKNVLTRILIDGEKLGTRFVV